MKATTGAAGQVNRCNEGLLRKTWYELTLVEGIRKLKFLTLCDQFCELIGKILDLTSDLLFGLIAVQCDDNGVFGVMDSSVRVSEVTHDLIMIEAPLSTATGPRSGKDGQVEVLPVRPIDNRCLVRKPKKRLPAVSTCDGVFLQSRPLSTTQEIDSWREERETLGSVESAGPPALGSCRTPISYGMISKSVPNRTSREVTLYLHGTGGFPGSLVACVASA
jgi:hypothetical protein